MNDANAAAAAGIQRAGASRRRRRVWVRWVVVFVALVALALGLARWLAPRRPPRLLPYPMQLPGALDLALVPAVTRFDFPLGSEHGAMSYNAQSFGTRGDVSEHAHLGDDLNGIGGYDTDLGDPVYAVADGRVLRAAPAGPGWGNVVILLHALADGGESEPRRIVQSFYAHLDRIDVRVGDTIRRGEPVGTIGTADGRYYAHLHLEMRDMLQPWIGSGYADDAVGWINPSAFLRKQRGAPDDDLAPSPTRGGSMRRKKDRQGDTTTRSGLPLLHFCPGGVGPSTPHDP